MLKFFAGILLAQFVAFVLARQFAGSATIDNIVLIAFPILLVTIVTTLWFSTVARQLADKRVAALEAKFAKEREKFNVDAEREKNRLLKKTQKEIASQTRRTRNRANVKIGVALTVAAGCGLLMMLTQFVTLGLLTMTTAGGALGGYLARARREQDQLPAEPEIKLINPPQDEQPDPSNLSSETIETPADPSNDGVANAEATANRDASDTAVESVQTSSKTPD